MRVYAVAHTMHSLRAPVNLHFHSLRMYSALAALTEQDYTRRPKSLITPQQTHKKKESRQAQALL